MAELFYGAVLVNGRQMGLIVGHIKMNMDFGHEKYIPEENKNHTV
ncbi:hypothetical protein [Sphingorhabdus lutea]|nr:hypothetical protein [Sphingorhabdus lutea]